MNECRKIEKQLWEYPDGELSAAEREAVSLHLEGCAACSRALETINALRESSRADRKAISSVDGCHLRGAPDPRKNKGNGPHETADSITDCTEQLEIYDILVGALAELTGS